MVLRRSLPTCGVAPPWTEERRERAALQIGFQRGGAGSEFLQQRDRQPIGMLQEREEEMLVRDLRLVVPGGQVEGGVERLLHFLGEFIGGALGRATFGLEEWGWIAGLARNAASSAEAARESGRRRF